MTAAPARAVRRGIDPRVAGWAAETLQRACAHLEQADELTAELTRYARELAPDWQITNPGLIKHIVGACHAAIALVLITDYRRARVLDPAEAADPDKTTAAVGRVFATFPRRQRAALVYAAAEKAAVYSGTAD
jgi:hypothetical protein